MQYVIVDFDDRVARVCRDREELEKALGELVNELDEDAADVKEAFRDKTLFMFFAGENIREIKPTVKYKMMVELPEDGEDNE